MMRQIGHRLSLAVGALAAALVVLGAGQALAQDKGTVTIASFGGKFQDGLRKALFKPFEEATGIKVVEATGISLAKIKAMVMTQNVEWDLFECVPSEYYVLSQQNMLEKIDYSLLDKTIMDQMDPKALAPYGVGFLSFSQVISYSTKKYSKENHPHTWAEVWDLKKFPGKRIFPAGDYEIEPMEPALLADGVAPDKLYPLDLDRAYKKSRQDQAGGDQVGDLILGRPPGSGGCRGGHRPRRGRAHRAAQGRGSRDRFRLEPGPHHLRLLGDPQGRQELQERS